MQEIWKDIEGYEGLYEISSLGNVRRAPSGRILKQNKNSYGYSHVGLSKEGKVKMICVHRLIANAFIPNPQNKPQVNHIDGNKSNNSISNLEWVSQKENIIHAFKTGLRKTSKINQYDLNGNFVKTYDTITEAGKNFSNISNRPNANISCAIRNKSATAFGYIWRYAD